tara:strand:+ start:59 stop:253 length:195 start_codon:yes stop_codon:yes gene_type:complete
MDESMYVFAARYAHTRFTGAAHRVVNEILKDWGNISESTRIQLRVEAIEATCNLEDWKRLIDKK